MKKINPVLSSTIHLFIHETPLFFRRVIQALKSLCFENQLNVAYYYYFIIIIIIIVVVVVIVDVFTINIIVIIISPTDIMWTAVCFTVLVLLSLIYFTSARYWGKSLHTFMNRCFHLPKKFAYKTLKNSNLPLCKFRII